MLKRAANTSAIVSDILDRLRKRLTSITGQDIKDAIAEIEKLRQRDDMLKGLENGGVDNWDWYSESLKDYYKKYYPDEVDDE